MQNKPNQRRLKILSSCENISTGKNKILKNKTNFFKVNKWN